MSIQQRDFRVSSESSLPPQRPVLLHAIMLMCLLVALASAWGTLMVVATDATYRVNGELVSRERFLLRVLPWLTTLGGVAAILAWALWRHRSWTRTVLAVITALGAAVVMLGSLLAPDRGWILRLGGFCFSVIWLAAWLTYFYRDRDVIAYYSAVRVLGGKLRR